MCGVDTADVSLQWGHNVNVRFISCGNFTVHWTSSSSSKRNNPNSPPAVCCHFCNVIWECCFPFSSASSTFWLFCIDKCNIFYFFCDSFLKQICPIYICSSESAKSSRITALWKLSELLNQILNKTTLTYCLFSSPFNDRNSAVGWDTGLKTFFFIISSPHKATSIKNVASQFCNFKAEAQLEPALTARDTFPPHSFSLCFIALCCLSPLIFCFRARFLSDSLHSLADSSLPFLGLSKPLTITDKNSCWEGLVW